MTNNPWGQLAEDSGAVIDTVTEEDKKHQLAACILKVVNEIGDRDVSTDVLVAALGAVIFSATRSAEERRRVVKGVARELHEHFQQFNELVAEDDPDRKSQ